MSKLDCIVKDCKKGASGTRDGEFYCEKHLNLSRSFHMAARLFFETLLDEGLDQWTRIDVHYTDKDDTEHVDTVHNRKHAAGSAQAERSDL